MDLGRASINRQQLWDPGYLRPLLSGDCKSLWLGRDWSPRSGDSETAPENTLWSACLDLGSCGYPRGFLTDDNTEPWGSALRDTEASWTADPTPIREVPSVQVVCSHSSYSLGFLLGAHAQAPLLCPVLSPPSPSPSVHRAVTHSSILGPSVSL